MENNRDVFLLLSYKGVDTWLEKTNGTIISHLNPIVDVDARKITATVNTKPKSSYSLRWRSTPGSPLSAWCQIYISPTHNEAVNDRVANHFMDKSKAHTQSRTTKGRLELPYKRNGFLKVPNKPAVEDTGDLGSVRLEIRRAKGRVVEEEIDDPENPGGEICNIDINVLDEDQEEKNKPPWIIFQFNFVDSRHKLEIPSRSRGRLQGRTLRSNAPPSSNNQGGPPSSSSSNTSPPRTLRQRRSPASTSVPSRPHALKQSLATQKNATISSSTATSSSTANKRRMSRSPSMSDLTKRLEEEEQRRKRLKRALSQKLEAISKENDDMERLLNED